MITKLVQYSYLMDLGYLGLDQDTFKILGVSNTVHGHYNLEFVYFFSKRLFFNFLLCRFTEILYLPIFRRLVLVRPSMLPQHLSVVLWTARQSNSIGSIKSIKYIFHFYMELYPVCCHNCILKSLQNMTHANDFF